MFLSPDPALVQGNVFRTRRMTQFLRMAEAVLRRRPRCRILDLGGDPAYWDALRHLWSPLALEITVLNLHVPGDPAPNGKGDPYVSVQGDARSLPDFPDNAFDLVHSNSVIEHVGSWVDQARMASETRRLAPSFFVQTPNYWFPLELHTRVPALHWMPRPWRRALVMRRACGFYERARSVAEAEAVLSDVRLLDFPSMQALFPDAAIRRERWGPWTKSLIAVRDRTGSAAPEGA